MPKTAVYNMSGEQVGEYELSDGIFGIEPNKYVLHEAVKNHLARRRQGTQSVLTRAEVSGGGRKPWRQKGTGRARTGSTRAPSWTHGGVAFAPKPRSYGYDMNKKMKRLALKSALSAKAADGEIILIDDLKMDEIKTKIFKEFLGKLNVQGKALVITEQVDENVIKSARNIPGVTTTFASLLSPYEVMNNGKLVVSLKAAEKIEEVYA